MSNKDKILAYKEILSAYRNGDEERYPDAFEDAFAALESLPELAQWFEQDQQFDDEFRTALNDFEVPEQKAIQTEPAKRIHFPLLKLAAAAVFVLVLGGIFLNFNETRQNQRAAALVDELRRDLTAFAASSFDLDAMNNDLTVLQELITSRGGSKGPILKDVFEKGLPMGCKIVELDSHTVSLYCFANDQQQIVHAFVLPINDLNGARAAKHMRAIVEYTDRDTGGWISGDSAYMLVSSMPGVDIKPFLLPAQEIYSVALKRNSVPATVAMTLVEFQ
ncbi:MAG: hypothetical protein V3V05_12235 [Pontiella sp.]